MTNSQPMGSYKLVTVNTAPERAFRLVGRVVEALKDRYTIIHAGNCETIAEVGSKVREIQPELLMCASMWTPEEADQILATGREVRPDIKTFAIPHGMQVEKGPDAVVEFLIASFPQWLDGKI